MRQVLVTNDDGIEADGLRALAEALAPLGRVTVVAPAGESSAVGHGLTVRRPLRLREVEPGWYSVGGTPADCVNVAMSEILGRVPDLVASGINNGLNVGDDVTYSGTVAAALEGVLFGAPAIAVSLQRGLHMDYAGAGGIARQLAEAMLMESLPGRTLLNVNVPHTAPRGVRVTVQARRRRLLEADGSGGDRNRRPGTARTPGRGPGGRASHDLLPASARTGNGRAPGRRPVGRRAEAQGGRRAGRTSSVWIGPAHLAWEPDERSDHEAILGGWVSVTPLHSDRTHHAALNAVDFLAESAPVGVE